MMVNLDSIENNYLEDKLLGVTRRTEKILSVGGMTSQSGGWDLLTRRK